jgi:hypothetical protein
MGTHRYPITLPIRFNPTFLLIVTQPSIQLEYVSLVRNELPIVLGSPLTEDHLLHLDVLAWNTIHNLGDFDPSSTLLPSATLHHTPPDVVLSCTNTICSNHISPFQQNETFLKVQPVKATSDSRPRMVFLVVLVLPLLPQAMTSVQQLDAKSS